MKRLGYAAPLFLIFLFGILCILTVEAVPIPPDTTNGEFVPGELFVRYNTGATVSGDQNISDLDVLSNRINTRYNLLLVTDYSEWGLTGLQLVRARPDQGLPELQAELAKEPLISYTSLNYIQKGLTVPDDPLFSNQWGLQNRGQFKGTPGADISAPSAWDSGTGSSEVIVAVVDTGVQYDHPDLALNMWTDPETGAHGYNVINDSGDPMDDNGHGTHCAGIIAAVGNNLRGIAGVSWNARVMGIKVLDNKTGGSTSDCIKGILWAKNHGADIISNSWGDYDNSPPLREAIEITGVLNVCAAGNEDKDNDIHPLYPASYPSSNIISVAASSLTDDRWPYSNYGNKTVQLAAPGENILSCSIRPIKPVDRPVYYEPFTSLDNWTSEGPWELNSSRWVSPPSSLYSGPFIQGKKLNLTLKEPVSFSNCTNPILGMYLLEDYNPVRGAILDLMVSADKEHWVSIIPDITETSYPTFTWIYGTIPEEFCDKPMYIRVSLNMVFKDTDHDGFWIDNLMIGDAGTAQESYVYKSGTSMATPCVAGAAALVLSEHPDYTYQELRSAILNTVDPIPGFAGKCTTGGRLNLSRAVSYIPPANLTVNFSASPASGFSPLTVQFTDSSTGTPPLAYQWDFGDGSVNSTETNPVHVFTTSTNQTFYVTLTVSNDSGSASRSVPIRVIAPLKPTFLANFTVSPVTGTAPLAVKCTDKSVGNPTRYIYDFGDGISEAGPNTAHIYRFPGNYSITLTITKYSSTSHSVIANSTRMVNIVTVGQVPFVLPVANFIASPANGTAPLTVTFTDQSTGNPNFYNYDFGDGVNMTGSNPIHTYRHPGNYSVTLSVMKNDASNGTIVSNASIQKNLIVVISK